MQTDAGSHVLLRVKDKIGMKAEGGAHPRAHKRACCARPSLPENTPTIHLT